MIRIINTPSGENYYYEIFNNMKKRFDILKYLPKKTTITSVPEAHIAWAWSDPKEVNITYHELNTRDVVSTFYKLQEKAISKILELENREKAERIITRIKNMSYF